MLSFGGSNLRQIKDCTQSYVVYETTSCEVSFVFHTGCIRRGNHSLGYQSGKGRNVSIAYLVYDLEGIGFHYVCIPESYFETKYRNSCAFGFIQSLLQSVNINLNECFFYVQLQ